MFWWQNFSSWNEALKNPDSRTCCSLVVLVHEVLVVIHSFMCMYLCFQFFPIIVWTDSLRLMLSFSFVLFLCYLLCFIINIAAVYFFDRYFVSTNATSTFHSIVSSYPGRLTLVTIQVSFYSYGSYVFFRKQEGLCPYLLLYISKLKKSTQKVRSEEKRKKPVLSDRV